MRYKIAYVDEDSGWLQTFYQTFKNDFTIQKIHVDGTSTVDSVLKCAFDAEIDGIVTDYLLDEKGEANFNGDQIVDAIRKHRPHFPIIMLTSYQPQAISQMDDVNIINGKEDLDGESDEKVEVLKAKIKTNIERYYSKIDNTEKRIEVLASLKNEKGLQPEEEIELTKLFILMDELNPDGTDIPANLVTREAVTAISDFVNETRKVLELLKGGK